VIGYINHLTGIFIVIEGELMAEKWYEGLSEDAFKSEEDKAYEGAFAKIREDLARGLDFDAACSGVNVPDENLRKNIMDDMLKVLIAEEHFLRKIPLEDLSRKLNLPVERIETAKAEMLEDVEKSAVDALHREHGAGNA
jgi:hypothetical protein